MIRRSTIIWSALAIGVGTGLFFVKHEVQALEDRLDAVNLEIAQNRETIHVLNAEWSHLTRPERLEDLGQRLLRMEPVTREQTIDITQLRDRLADIETQSAKETSGTRGARKDKSWVRPIKADLEKRR